MKRKRFGIFIATVFVFLVFFASLVFLNIPSVLSGNTATFDVSLTINNSAPIITYVEAASDSPSEATTKIIAIKFNASDVNCVLDIPASNARISINKSGVMLNSTACYILSSTSIVNAYTCNITVDYYRASGLWTINASIYDGAAETAIDTTGTFTMGTTYGISLKTNSLTFSGTPGQTNIAASNAPQIVNNTGNFAFTTMNITAFDLESGSNVLGSGNFSVNTTDSSDGKALLNNTPVAVDDASLSVQGTRDLYIYLDIPQGTNGTYTSPTPWIVSLS